MELQDRISEKFRDHRHPVPLDMNTLTALKRCALGLDDLWLTYRTFALRDPLIHILVDRRAGRVLVEQARRTELVGEQDRMR